MTKITKQQNEVFAAIVAAGKTPWAIIANDSVLGMYSGRQAARDANAGFKINGEKTGTVALAQGIMFEVITDALPVAEPVHSAIAEFLAEPVSAPVSPEVERYMTEGMRVSQAVAEAVAKVSKKIPTTRESTVERPCKRVWHIADEMKEAAGGVDKIRRKDVLARCVKEGIAFYTARTQYQLWLTIQNGGSI